MLGKRRDRLMAGLDLWDDGPELDAEAQKYQLELVDGMLHFEEDHMTRLAVIWNDLWLGATARFESELSRLEFERRNYTHVRNWVQDNLDIYGRL